MLPIRALAVTALAVAAFVAAMPGVAPGQESEKLSCLTPAQRRDLVAGRKVVPLATALRAVRGAAEARAERGRARNEVINARLCRGPNGLVYRLTVLARDGKVARLTVDAANGKLVGGD